MPTLKDVDQQKFVVAFAQHLKKGGKLKVPEWSDMVKTGKHKELAPVNPDWYYIRCASVLRRIYFRGKIGITGVAKRYGGRKRRGVAPSHFKKGSTSVARKTLQSLEGIKLIAKDELGGRKLTPTGRRDADRIASQIAKTKTA